MPALVATFGVVASGFGAAIGARGFAVGMQCERIAVR